MTPVLVFSQGKRHLGEPPRGARVPPVRNPSLELAYIKERRKMMKEYFQARAATLVAPPPHKWTRPAPPPAGRKSESRPERTLPDSSLPSSRDLTLLNLPATVSLPAVASALPPPPAPGPTSPVSPKNVSLPPQDPPQYRPLKTHRRRPPPSTTQ